MLSILSWIILGLVAGAIAKLVMPGKQGGGFIVTTALGIVGAMLGGFLGSFLPFLSDGIDGFRVGTVFTAVVGALIVLFIYQKITAKK